jgi:hypothetical protein
MPEQEGKAAMPYAIVHEHPRGTREQYEAAINVVHPPGGLPEGQIFHAAGPSADGWVILAIFDTRESWERYVDDVLTPEFTAGIEGTFTSGYNAIEFDVEVLEP